MCCQPFLVWDVIKQYETWLKQAISDFCKFMAALRVTFHLRNLQNFQSDSIPCSFILVDKDQSNQKKQQPSALLCMDENILPKSWTLETSRICQNLSLPESGNNSKCQDTKGVNKDATIPRTSIQKPSGHCAWHIPVARWGWRVRVAGHAQMPLWHLEAQGIHFIEKGHRQPVSQTNWCKKTKEKRMDRMDKGIFLRYRKVPFH